MEKKEFSKKLGKTIADYRKLKNLTQQELANELNIQRAALARIENGGTTAKINLIEKISYVLGIDLLEIEEIASYYKKGFKEKSGELAKHSLESFQRMALGFMPGGHVVEEFINFRSTLKQKRILDFSESVKKALEEIAKTEIDPGNFTSEKFVDLMDAVYKRVQESSSEKKLESFKNILVNQIIEPTSETPMLIKYVQLVEQLDDAQILILSDFRFWIEKDETVTNIIVAYEGIHAKNLKDDDKIERLSNRLGRVISRAEVEYFTNELVSIGLVKNNVEIETQMGGSNTKNDFKISKIGIDFLNFIELTP